MDFKISIVIATFNSGKTLKQTLDSIRYQTYKNIELIIIDGLSSDNTLAIIKEYNDIVTKYISEKDNGIYEAFNKGIKMATGDYICFIGSDDCYYNYYSLEKIIEELSDDVDVLSACVNLVFEENNTEMLIKSKRSISDIMNGRMLPHQGLLVKTKLMKEYMFSEKYKIISDYEFLLRYVIDGGKIKYCNYPVVYFSNGGISSNSINSDTWENNILEHIAVYRNLNLDRKYLFGYLNQIFKYKEFENIHYLIILFAKKMLKKLRLVEIMKRLLRIKRKHKCNLKYCRWCDRYNN